VVFNVDLFVGRSSIGRHFLHVDDVEAYVLKFVGTVFHWRVWGKAMDYCLDRLPEFGEKVK
jgi:hypothetical protein